MVEREADISEEVTGNAGPGAATDVVALYAPAPSNYTTQVRPGPMHMPGTNLVLQE